MGINKNQVVFISGIGGNLGKQIAKHYLNQEFNVVGLTSKDSKKFNDLNLSNDLLKNLYVVLQI